MAEIKVKGICLFHETRRLIMPDQLQGEEKMYLSIGNDMAVRDSSIIGIFDMDNTTTSKRTREFLKKAQQEGSVVSCDDLPKSFVVTAEYGMVRVYESTMYSSTLEKRISTNR